MQYLIQMLKGSIAFNDPTNLGLDTKTSFPALKWGK